MKSQKIKGAVGILIMSFGIVGMFLWLSYGQKAYSTTTVLVAAENIERGTTIGESEKESIKSYFKKEKVDSSQIIEGALYPKDEEALKGLAAKYKIPKNSQLTRDMFDKTKLVLKDGEYVMKIPATWVYAVPSSIRRNDQAYFFEVDATMDQFINRTIEKDKTTAELNNKNAVPSVISKDDEKKISDLILDSIKPVLQSTVAYVKDSANREVIDAGKNERYDGAAQIATIEIIVTEENKRTLEESIKKGMKFLVLYR